MIIECLRFGKKNKTLPYISYVCLQEMFAYVLHMYDVHIGIFIRFNSNLWNMYSHGQKRKTTLLVKLLKKSFYVFLATTVPIHFLWKHLQKKFMSNSITPESSKHWKVSPQCLGCRLRNIHCTIFDKNSLNPILSLIIQIHSG